MRTMGFADGTFSVAVSNQMTAYETTVGLEFRRVLFRSTQTAGAAQALTITATDPYGNTDLTYTGAHNLTFSGANSSTNPVTAPTVTNNAATAINFGSTTAVTFTSGVSSSGGSMKLYKVESPNIAVTDGTPRAPGAARLRRA